MNDFFICKLFSEVFQKMGLSAKASPALIEYSLIVDDIHPVVLRYDALTERVLLINTLDIKEIPEHMHPLLMQRMLKAGLNPLRAPGPGIGHDEKSDLYFSYIALPRHSVTADEICKRIIELVEWSTRLLAVS